MKHLDTNDAAVSATFDFARPSRAAAIDSDGAKASRFDTPDFNALFESSGEALLEIDASGVIQKANGRGRELLRLKEPIPRHISLKDVVPGLTASQIKSLLGQNTSSKKLPSLEANLANGFPIRITFRSALSGSRCPLLCLEDGAMVKRAHATGTGQSHSRMLQTEKMAALGQFVSGIAHELNNPLTAIMGYAQLLLGRGLSERQFSEANKVYQEAERARRIVKNLLYFAREDKPERTRVDMNEIIERTVALRSYELKNENINVACELAPELPRTMGDPYQLQQVILNLLMNAEQALLEERGQGNIWIRTHYHGQRGAQRIFVEISDDGPGISSEIASRIFDPFFTTKPFGVGTGLGLSIVYGIVQQHDGEVTVESLPGTGARFVVDLPVIQVPEENRAPSPPQFADQPGVVSAGRILVVEDEPSVAQLVFDVLREEGHRVEVTLDSQEGLTRLSRTHYDLVICDLRMPRLDGVAFYDALVRAGSPMRNQMLFITGDMVAPRTLAFLEPNALPYLAKPFLVEELKIAVHRLLARGPQSANLAASEDIQRAAKV